MGDKKYYWLKLKKDFFKRHDIQIIESMPNGKDYVLFYLKLLVESVDHDGGLRFNDTIPYSENMLATITNTNIDIVRSAMKMFIDLKMIDLLEDKTIYMNEIQKMLGTETYWAEQKRKQRENSPKEIGQCPQGVQPMSNLSNQEIELDKEIDINKKDKKVKENIYTDVFEKFFSEYPKGGQTLKPQTFKNFQSLIKKKVNPDELIQAAKNYATDCKVAEVQPPYFKKSSNFLGKDAAYLNYVNSEWIPVKPKFYSQNKQPIDNGMNLPEI